MGDILKRLGAAKAWKSLRSSSFFPTKIRASRVVALWLLGLASWGTVRKFKLIYKLHF
jgi:hypothetical protein